MTIQSLLANVEVIKVKNYTNVNVLGIEIDSRKELSGKVFFCLKGERSDGNEFVSEAEKKGAVAIVSESEIPTSLPLFVVKNVRKSLAVACGNFYDNPAEKMNIVTVVGTNGKTSTTEILSSIFSAAGFKTATIGTLGYSVDGERREGVLTTPDPMELHYNLSAMRMQGVQYVFMEASAHAIHYDKLAGIKAKAGILTNVTQDHLDFFKDMETYANVKLSYFCHPNTALAVVNSDDPYGVRLLENPLVPTITYGIRNPADVFAIDIQENENGLSFTMNAFDCIINVRTPLFGRFNVYNVMAATATAMYMGIRPITIRKALEKISIVPGRYDMRFVEGRRFIVDYAHTPDGLENLLKDAKENYSGKLFTVFGCGGNRDKGKRPIMGKVASEYSSHVIVTDDNPRFEDESEIAREIAAGIENGASYEIVLNRAEAIERAYALSEKGDTIVVAGKGHETYIDRKGEKKPFSDFEIIQQLGK